MKQYYPPRIKEIIAPAGFVDDLELQQKIVDDKMTRDYVSLMFACSLLLIVAVLL
jgi:hypothetical protein